VTITDGGAARPPCSSAGARSPASPGRKLVVEGVAGKQGSRYLIFNPV
jgi:hypothetical protein